MQTNKQLYQLDYSSSPWQTFCYTITRKSILDESAYRVRRFTFRKYLQLEDINNKKLFYIDTTTIKSAKNNETLVAMKILRKTIETVVGNFIISDLDVSQRSYTLKMDDKIIARIQRKSNLEGDGFTIELEGIYRPYHAFVLSIIVLIDSALQTMQNSVHLLYSLHIPQSPTIYSYYKDCSIVQKYIE